LVIADDGTGMTLDDIQSRWLSPAVDHKERAKAVGRRTALGRLPIGEKGVGRFALHQLGRSLERITRVRGGPELTVSIDWDLYDGDGYLDTVPVEIIERQPVVFAHTSGTQLTIRRPRAPWDDKLATEGSASAATPAKSTSGGRTQVEWVGRWVIESSIN
jgi:hypothetical protein